MSNDKVKTYKNNKRNLTTEYVPYVPQYQVLGIEPEQHKSATVTGNPRVARNQPLPSNNPRARRVLLQQPYAEVKPSPVGRGPIPNVGNNIDHTWSGVDGEIVDDLNGDLQIDPDQSMIDNNDFVSEVAIGLPEDLPSLDEVRTPPAKIFSQNVFSAVRHQGPDDLTPIVCDLEEGAYLLIVSGTAVCSGPMEEIQEQANAMVFGDHEICDGNPIPDSDIIILKRVSIKIGLFLE